MSILRSFIALLVAISLVSGCVTEKKKGDISASKKFYHNTTAYYNAFFNAEELMAESILNMQNAHVDNYNQILSVYDYTNLQNPKLEANNLDVAIEKVSKSASLHRQSHWVDDCYVMIGRAQFYKQDFETAEETLLFFEDEFDPKNPYGKNYDPSKNASRAEKEQQRKRDQKVKKAEKKQQTEDREEKQKDQKKTREAEKKAREKARKAELKARKKKGGRSSSSSRSKTDSKKTSTEDNKDVKKEEEKKKEEKKEEEEDVLKDGAFSHTTAYWKGLYWLARTLIERENFSSADYYLNKISGSNAQQDVRKEIPIARAHLNIKNKDYNAALNFLDEAITLSDDKLYKARYAYIRAQIFERLGNPSAAFKEYERCKSLKPNFEMGFYADINEIKLSHSIGKMSSDAAIKKMERMSEEDKFQEYVGPIYFSIGEVLLKDGKTSAAIDAFKKGTSDASAKDPDLFYKLANLLFEQEDYIAAKEYYEKTLSFMPKSDDRYPDVKKYAGSLKDISVMIKQVELQDSLLNLAGLSDSELRERAIEAIQNQPAEVIEGKNLSQQPVGGVRAGRRYGSGQSSFFAYNATGVNQGKQSFERKWGERVLEDNWRRSAVGSSFFDEGNEEAEDNEVSEEQIQAFIDQLPTSKLGQETANRKLSQALFDLGFMYRDRLQNFKKSDESFSRLEKEFPEYLKLDQAFFYQYLNHEDLGNKSKAQKYINLLKEKFPDSRFTKIATDPNYVREQLAEENKLEEYYTKTYEFFEEKDFETVINRGKKSEKQFGATNEFAGKFALLSAMSVGSTLGQEEYVKALEQLVKRYPNTDEQKRAKEILRFLKGDDDAFSSIIYDEETLNFEKSKDALHYVIIVMFDVSGKEVDETKISVSNFNRKFFKADRLQQSDIALNRENNSHLILIRKYTNEAKAMDYWRTVQKNVEKFITSDVNYEVLPVSQSNYREVIKQKSINAYRAFFETEYEGN